MTDFETVLKEFDGHGVRVILIGGVAAIVHGSARHTVDIAFVYDRSEANIDRLVDALRPHHPYLRGAPPGLPFSFDAATVCSGLNFTLTTDLGDIDLLGEVTGGGGYQDLVPYTIKVELNGAPCLCLDLETLIRVKRAAGRPKDFEAIAELEALLEERDRAGEN